MNTFGYHVEIEKNLEEELGAKAKFFLLKNNIYTRRSYMNSKNKRKYKKVPTSSMSNEAAIKLYLCWKNKQIVKKQRVVKLSKEFEQLVLTDKQKTLLNKFIKRSEKGYTLRSYQSKLVDSTELDNLYATWQIHHFHLGEDVSDEEFVSRTDDLIFAQVTEKEILIIGMYKHGDWYEKGLIEILDSNWPSLLEKNYDGLVQIEAKELSLSFDELTGSDIKKLRESNIVFPIICSSGRQYMGLVCADGVPYSVTQEIIGFYRFIGNFERQSISDICNDYPTLIEGLSSYFDEYPSNQFKIVMKAFLPEKYIENICLYTPVVHMMSEFKLIET